MSVATDTILSRITTIFSKPQPRRGLPPLPPAARPSGVPVVEWEDLQIEGPAERGSLAWVRPCAGTLASSI